MKYQVASPILGFEHIGEYTLTQIDDFFYTLENGDISFTLIDPSRIREYDIDIPPFYVGKLQLEETDAVKVLAIMVVQNPIEESVINFLAPVVLNETKKVLAQIALDEEKYPQYQLAEKIGRYL